MAEKNNENINVNIVTPDGEVFTSEIVKFVSLSSTSGEIGVLKNHVPILASLSIGQLKIVLNNDEVLNFSIQGGFADFNQNNLTIVSDSAENAKDVDVARAKQAEKRARDRISNSVDTEEIRRAEVALRRAINRVHVSEFK